LTYPSIKRKRESRKPIPVMIPTTATVAVATSSRRSAGRASGEA
jgi:hypothetical protein